MKDTKPKEEPLPLTAKIANETRSSRRSRSRRRNTTTLAEAVQSPTEEVRPAPSAIEAKQLESSVPEIVEFAAAVALPVAGPAPIVEGPRKYEESQTGK
jgi:hypothetical protein